MAKAVMGYRIKSALALLEEEKLSDTSNGGNLKFESTLFWIIAAIKTLGIRRDATRKNRGIVKGRRFQNGINKRIAQRYFTY